ncbi:hypothetical protein QBC40DRAFT_343123 [Triangularia verruculosa]|uniref:Uncharacterized protein n=1 Tax=Triangularia verruculosa TaxID=2587418 RepID=A0AAN7AQS1_9PEZI|nr:hypothetical protein QBC40DRAFT_343123 [Triangularia verruculosa]
MELDKLPTSSAHSSNDHQITDNMEAPMYQTYPQDAFAYGHWTNGPEFPPTFPMSGPDGQYNGVWREDLHVMTTSYDMPTMFPTSNDVAWSMQEQGQTGGFSQSPTATSPVVYQGQDTEWNSMPPQLTNGFASGTWVSNDQLQTLPSPLSEAPSYGNYTFNHRTPSDYEPQPVRTTAAPIQQGSFCSTTDSASPAASTAAVATVPAPKAKPKAKGKGKAAVSKPSKRSPESSSKSRTSSGTKRKSPAPSGDNAKPPPFLGIFPPDVDPREASAKIQREAWERCKTEVLVMSQRRLLLLDHERGALERETQKLQDNLALMREAAAREHGQLQKAVRKAEKLNARRYY